MDPQPVLLLKGAVLDDRPDDASASRSLDHRLLDDLSFCAEIGMSLVRLDVPWALAQPRAGRTDGGVIERQRRRATAARALGLQPWFRLLQPTLPTWFDDEGGFTDPKVADRWWPRWVEEVANQLGDLAAGWVPFEAPYAMARRLVPDDPRRHGELMETLVVAWRDAWRVLRGGPPVATALDVQTERPDGPTQEHLDAARRRDRLRWGLWLDGLAHGRVRVPGRADRDLPDLEGACDLLGLAARSEIASHLHRAAEQGPDRPLALTFRPVGNDDTERASSVTAMWRDVRAAESDLRITSVTIATLLDRADRPGIATARRQLKDSGEAFLERA